MKTVYECRKTGDTKPHYAKTEVSALGWLSLNGGGEYRNELHSFQMNVKANDYPSYHKFAEDVHLVGP